MCGVAAPVSLGRDYSEWGKERIAADCAFVPSFLSQSAVVPRLRATNTPAPLGRNAHNIDHVNVPVAVQVEARGKALESMNNNQRWLAWPTAAAPHRQFHHKGGAAVVAGIEGAGVVGKSVEVVQPVT